MKPLRTVGIRWVRCNRGVQRRRAAEQRRASRRCAQYAANILALTPETSPSHREGCKRRRLQPPRANKLHFAVRKLAALPPMLSPIPPTPTSCRTPLPSPANSSTSSENSRFTPPNSSVAMDWSSFRAQLEKACKDTSASSASPSCLDASMESLQSSSSSVALDDWSSFRESINSLRCSTPISMPQAGDSISPGSLMSPSPRSSRCTDTQSSHSSESVRSPSPVREFWSPGCPLPGNVERPSAVFRVRPGGTPRTYRGRAPRRVLLRRTHVDPH